MQSYTRIGALAAGLAAVLGGVIARMPARAQDDVTWLADWESARAVSRQTGKPVFAAFR